MLRLFPSSARNPRCRGNGVIITNWAKVTPAFSAISTVASKVAARSVGSPKMNEPSKYPVLFGSSAVVAERLAGVVPILEHRLQSLRSVVSK